MQREHPEPAMALPVSLEIYQKLVSASVRTGFRQEIWEIGAAAIREWLSRHNPESFQMPSLSGYQWKNVFLPDGTLLRTIFNGRNFHCRVEGDAIIYNGEKVSPCGFVNAAGGVRRNAWKSTWILFPNSSVWKSAESLRTKKKSRKPAT
ncbi:hypothetical protein [Massilia solisilvae]